MHRKNWHRQGQSPGAANLGLSESLVYMSGIRRSSHPKQTANAAYTCVHDAANRQHKITHHGTTFSSEILVRKQSPMVTSLMPCLMPAAGRPAQQSDDCMKPTLEWLF